MRHLLILLLATVLLPACTPAAGGGERPMVNRYVITEAEMRAHRIVQAEEAIRVLRPNWLRGRGVSTFGQDNPVRVYYDPSIGGLPGLHELPPGQVGAIYYYPAVEAQARFGLDHTQGAIVVALPGGSLP